MITRTGRPLASALGFEELVCGRDSLGHAARREAGVCAHDAAGCGDATYCVERSVLESCSWHLSIFETVASVQELNEYRCVKHPKKSST
mmetsp:Transcript_18816/g.41327  ORF Transcript_18816/g.41327 Transcript_18816/m.41327 type:complete len:89 (+) Transcript_18816:21-287(+)